MACRAADERCQRTIIVVTLQHSHMRGRAMSITTLSSRELNQDIGRAKRAARNGPVIITDRGRPVHVLLS